MATTEKPFRPDLNVRLICPECRQDPPDIVERFAEGDMICANCGLVLSDRIVDERSEWRTFSNDDHAGDDPSRVGDAGNPLLDGSQLDTIVAVGAPGSNLGRDLSRVQNDSSNDRRGNALLASFGRISQMCEADSLPRTVQDAAKQAYKLVFEQSSLRSRSQQSVMAASIIVACRHARVPRTFKEIAVLTGVPPQDIGKTFKLMQRILQNNPSDTLGALGGDSSSLQSSQTRAEDLMRRFCSRLGLSMQTTRAAEYIARRIRDEGTLAGRSPTSVAAAAIYMATALFDEQLPGATIAEHTDVSDGTIRASYRLIYNVKEKLVDPEWISSGIADLSRLPRV